MSTPRLRGSTSKRASGTRSGSSRRRRTRRAAIRLAAGRVGTRVAAAHTRCCGRDDRAQARSLVAGLTGPRDGSAGLPRARPVEPGDRAAAVSQRGEVKGHISCLLVKLRCANRTQGRPAGARRRPRPAAAVTAVQELPDVDRGRRGHRIDWVPAGGGPGLSPGPRWLTSVFRNRR